jgi:hypothetical protein
MQDEDPRSSNEGGIYCVFGLDEKEECDFFYIGKASNF